LSGLAYISLFIFGLAVGSFLNVVVLRYKEEGGLFANIYGRSRCMHCGKTLRWYELIPLISFFAQRGRCRACGKKISWQYPIVEFLTGLIFTLVPYKIISLYQHFYSPYLLIFIWVLAFLTLLLISAIDYRYRIIPDSLNIFIALLGVAVFFIHGSLGDFGLNNGIVGESFLGSYALMFFIGNSQIVNALAGVTFGILFIGLIYLLTRGKGIGFGDVKLAAAAGLLMGWPDIALSLLLAFIVGAIVSVGLMILKRKTIHDAVPFGPFIAVGITIVFFLGYDIVNMYFRLFNIV
jgi:leader peptidase (prepilin peptidase)/N-methyltransferase